MLTGIVEEFGTVEEALDAYARGSFVVLIGSSERERTLDLIIAADTIDEAQMEFMDRHTSGTIYAPMPGERADELGLPRTVGVAVRHDTAHDDSAADHIATLRALVDPSTRHDDLSRPGHIVPLPASAGGVLMRAGHAEAAVDLGSLSGRSRVGVMRQILGRDDVVDFARHHDLSVLSIADLVRYRRRHEKLVERLAMAKMPTRHGEFDVVAYRSKLDGEEHVAFVLGDVDRTENVLVRVHSECLTGDLFGSLRCDCGSQLDAALDKIGNEGRGVIVYLRGHEGRGIGIAHKVRAYALQDQGHDTVDANTLQGLPVDSRDYGIGAQILTDLGVTTMRLMTNNPAKYAGLQGLGLEITERVALDIAPNPDNVRYLQTKRQRLGHLLGDAGTHGQGITSSRTSSPTIRTSTK